MEIAVMKSKIKQVAFLLLLGLGVGAVTVTAAPPVEAAGACPPGDRIDSSTAEQAKRKFEKAGFSSVKELHKGCDNFWHTVAVKDGKRVRAVLSPQGEIVLEGE
jgi:hypothetical protein